MKLIINNTKRYLLILALFLLPMLLAADKSPILDYEVLAVDVNDWIVTAKETETGNKVIFRLPPSVFVGQTFDANIIKIRKGERFSVRGPENAQLKNLIVKKKYFRETKKHQVAQTRSMRRESRPLTWEIMEVDSKRWVVTARNRHNQKIIKFRCHPEAFTGFRFRANLRGVREGHGFSIITPNTKPIKKCCTLLEEEK